MLTRRDLIHSRQFLRRRLHTALVAQRPDPLDWSGTRLPALTLISVMLIVICAAGAGIYGYFRPAGAKSWTSCDRVIIEKETGAAYVCDGQKLYPTMNFASALLLRGLANPPVSVSRSSLTWPRGPVVGIPDAPNTIPAPGVLLTGPWSFCMRPGAPPRSVIAVGQAIMSGPLLLNEAVAVSSTGSQLSIVYRGRKHEVRDRDVVAQALVITTPDIIAVSGEWLATLPAGAPIGKIEIEGRGGAVEGLTNIKAGQLLRRTEDQKPFVARAKGIQPIMPLQEALIRATAKDTTPSTSVSQLQLAGATVLEPLAEPALGDGQVPPIVPLTRSRGAICQIVGDASDVRGVSVGVVVPNTGIASHPDRASAAGALLADEIQGVPGKAALVMAKANPAADAGTVYLITETGRRHAISSAEALGLLGLGEAGFIELPSTFLERLPQGPVLTKLALVTSVP